MSRLHSSDECSSAIRDRLDSSSPDDHCGHLIDGERVGIGRSYVKLEEPQLTFDKWCDGLSAGLNYASDGFSHLLDFTVRPGRWPTGHCFDCFNAKIRSASNRGAGVARRRDSGDGCWEFLARPGRGRLGDGVGEGGGDARPGAERGYPVPAVLRTALLVTVLLRPPPNIIHWSSTTLQHHAALNESPVTSPMAAEAGSACLSPRNSRAETDQEAVSFSRHCTVPLFAIRHIERARIGETMTVPLEVRGPCLSPDWPFLCQQICRVIMCFWVHFQVVVNGYPVATTEIVADGSVHDLSFEIEIPRSAWCTPSTILSSLESTSTREDCSEPSSAVVRWPPQGVCPSAAVFAHQPGLVLCCRQARPSLPTVSPLVPRQVPSAKAEASLRPCTIPTLPPPRKWRGPATDDSHCRCAVWINAGRTRSGSSQRARWRAPRPTMNTLRRSTAAGWLSVISNCLAPGCRL